MRSGVCSFNFANNEFFVIENTLFKNEIYAQITNFDLFHLASTMNFLHNYAYVY